MKNYRLVSTKQCLKASNTANKIFRNDQKNVCTSMSQKGSNHSVVQVSGIASRVRKLLAMQRLRNYVGVKYAYDTCIVP